MVPVDLTNLQKLIEECKILENLVFIRYVYLKKNFMVPFYGWGSNAPRLQALRRGSLLFTIQFPEIPGTHYTDLGMMTG